MFNRQRLAALFISCLIVFGADSAFAGQLKKHNAEFGPEVYHFRYEEPGLMEDKGWFYGINGSYTYHNKLMLKAEGRFSYGQVDYTSSGSGSIDNIDDYVFEFRGMGGYDFPASENSFVTPYIGIGYRYLNDDASGRISTTGHYGYERESNYIYSPVGIKLIADLQSSWSVGATAEYDIFWWGKQISYLSDVSRGYNNIENRQKKGYGARGSIKIEKNFKRGGFGVEPFIRYWNIKESERADLTWYGTKIGEAWEPKNKTTELGVNFLIRF